MNNLTKLSFIVAFFISIAFSQQLVITEVFSKIHASTTKPLEADANGDGVFGKVTGTTIIEDEFIEIINYSPNQIDIGGYQIYSQEYLPEPWHIFPDSTRLIEPWEIIVVFSGGNPDTGLYNDNFNDALVQISTSGQTIPQDLSDNKADTLFIKNLVGDIVNATEYIPPTDAASVTRETISGVFNQNHQTLNNLSYYLDYYSNYGLIVDNKTIIGFSPGVFFDWDQSLSVELSSFIGSLINGNAQLNWTTGSECNNRGFILERKENSQDWISIASYLNNSNLVGAGNTSEATEYQFVDTEVKPGNIYSYRLTDVDESGTETTHYENIVNIEYENEDEILYSFKISSIYPNPFNPSTVIKFNIPEKQNININVYNMQGKLISKLYSGTKNAGVHHITWNASSYSSGIYFVHMTNEKKLSIQKCIFIK